MFRLAIAGLLAIGLVTGCMSPGGNTVEEKRQAVQEMRSETLAELYEIHPEAQSQIDKLQHPAHRTTLRKLQPMRSAYTFGVNITRTFSFSLP